MSDALCSIRLYYTDTALTLDSNGEATPGATPYVELDLLGLYPDLEAENIEGEAPGAVKINHNIDYFKFTLDIDWVSAFSGFGALWVAILPILKAKNKYIGFTGLTAGKNQYPDLWFNTDTAKAIKVIIPSYQTEDIGTFKNLTLDILKTTPE